MTDTNTLALTDEAYDLIDRYLRNNLDDTDYAEYSTALEAVRVAPAPVSEPYAYEFSRSNGDGTHSVHIERGSLQEVAPGRWEHSGLPRGALADKPIKALYTTPQTQPVALASDSASSLANDPRLCCRSHPHEKQSLHCQLREVAAWLRWHAAAGKTPSADSMRAHSEQVDAVALELRSAPAGMEPVAWLIERSAFRVSPHGQDAEGNEWLEEAHEPGESGSFAVYTGAQVQAMLSQGLAPGWKAVPVAWLHDCAALLTNDVELWIDACPHCGKPRNAPPPVERQPLTDEQIEALPAWSHFVGLWPESRKEIVRAIEAAHGIK